MRHIRGQISYRNGAHETGREFFSVSIFPDGSRTVRCECHFDVDDLVRDSIFTLDAEWRPVDAYLRVARSREFLGAGWYRFDNTGTTCHALGTDRGERQIARPSKSRAPACGFHPIFNDGLWSALFDLGRPTVVQRIAGCITYSTQQVGNAPLGIETFDLDLRYIGRESLTVAAGTFDCRHFEALIPGLAAPFKLWTWSDDYIIVRETWAEMPGQSFELQTLAAAIS